MKIIKKQIEVTTYVTARGDEIPVREMVNLHLLNAYALASSMRDAVKGQNTPEERELIETEKVLQDEILRRINHVPE